jgi:hypothetical protein
LNSIRGELEAILRSAQERIDLMKQHESQLPLTSGLPNAFLFRPALIEPCVPLSSGVLVCRDFDDDNALTDEDLKGAQRRHQYSLERGSGTKNWSAGCQVLAGARYVNLKSAMVDCSEFDAGSYGDLPNMTWGACNVLLDLMTVFAPGISVRDGSIIYYTVMYQSDLDKEVGPGRTLAAEALETVSRSQSRGVRNQDRIHRSIHS